MASPSSSADLLDLVQKSGLVEPNRLTAYTDKLRADNALPPDAKTLGARLIADGLLTNFQAEQILQGKWRRFNIGKYKVLEKLGSGGMGSVFLCEHKIMRRLVAVKVLPTAKANDPSALERFERESKAIAALDHPNIVRAHDIDVDDKLHFLVMEYVDGASLQDIVKKTGQMDFTRAAHYIQQAALGLQHAHDKAGLVHRDVKPGNVLVDRYGVVKLLDMGLARFFHDEEDMLTKKYDENVLGTADYLAPEQATDSHSVDIRADIYSLGATFYFCLTGRTPFAEGTVAQKLIWHQTRMPKPVRGFRTDVPEELLAVLDKAMAKDPGQRYQLPIEFAEALDPWTQEPIGPPPDDEMPQLAPILKRTGLAPDSNPAIVRGGEATGEAPSSRKVWQVPGGTPSPRPNSKPAPPPIAGPSPTRPKTPGSVKVPPGPAPVPPPTVVRRPVAKQPANLNGRPRPAPTKQTVATAEPDALAADTTPGIHAGTTPPVGSKRKIPVPKASAPPTLLRDRPVLFWCLVAVGVVLALLALTGLVWLAGHTFASAAPATGTPNQPLYVGGKDGLTIEQALGRARANDRIVLQHDIEASGVAITWPNLTIESAPGQTCTWHAPPKADDGATLMIVNNVEGLTVKNLKFDGEERAGTLIQVRGKCPDLKLQDLTLVRFTNHGLHVTSAEGTAARPILFTRLEINHRGRPQWDLLFDLDAPADGTRFNQYFHISECKSAKGDLEVNGRDTLRNVQPADFAKNP